MAKTTTVYYVESQPSGKSKRKQNKKKKTRNEYKMWRKAAGEAMKKMAELISMEVDCGNDSSDGDDD